ncbi:unnamed protein product, partial [Musa acuminata var. zebrina]
TPGILNALVIAFRLLSPIATLYSLLSNKTYCSIIKSKETLIATFVNLLGASNVLTRSIKDILKVDFGLIIYPLNRTTLIELGIVPPLFAPVVKDERKGMVVDATIVIIHVAGCDESVKAF